MKRLIFSVFTLIMAMAPMAVGQQAAKPPEQPAPPPQPPVTFRAEVNYVEVDARVMDAQGRFVGTLSQDDFEVLEDGKPQKVTVFSLVNLPVERMARPLFASQPIEPDVKSNLENNGRVYVIVLDDLHTHPLRSTRVKVAARQFVERYVGANDLAAVVHTGGRTDAAQEFTNNQRLLVAAIDKFMGRKLRSSVMNRIEEEARTRGLRQPGDSIRDTDEFERAYQARNTLSALKNLAEFMEGVRGRRKAVVLFSEGIDYDINDVFANRDATSIIDATRDTIAAATRANVAIYGIDPRGLTSGLDDAIEIQSFPDDPTLGLGTSALQNEVRLGQDSLRVLSDETGGFAAVNRNDFAAAFQRVVDDNSSYYVLGYYPSNDRRDGRFRRIDVRVKRPGLTVRARRGYVAPRGRVTETKLAGPKDASVELREALSSPMPVSSLALAVTAAVFKGPSPNGSVVVSTLIGGRDLPLAEKDGTFHNDVEVGLIAMNETGKVFGGDRNTLNLTLKPDTMKRVRASGFRVISSIDLPPGRYQLRVGVREANTKRAGSVLYDVDVPDYSKEALAVSSIALTSASSGFAPTVRPKDPLEKMLPGPLSSYREFSANDELAMFAEVYDSNKQPHKVGITITAKAEGGQTVFETREEHDSSELGGSSGGYGVTAKIPLAKFASGLYVLRVEAQSQIGERLTAARETVFGVVGGPQTTTAEAVVDRTPQQKPAPPVIDRTTPPVPTKPTPAVPPVPGAPSAPGDRTPPAAPTAPIQMITIASDLMSAVDRPRQTIARTATEWETLWRTHAPGRQVPKIDFAKQMVVAVFLGSRPTAGYLAQITGVRRDGDALVVQWSEVRPGQGAMSAQVMTAPSHMVVIPRHEGAVRFEKLGG